MTEPLQGVDEDDRDSGPLEEQDLPGGIHRRVALFVLDENDRFLLVQSPWGWSVPNQAVRYRQTSEDNARQLLRDLGIGGTLDPLGGILHLRDQYSSQTHIFLVRWNGSGDPPGKWAAHPEDAYSDFAKRSLRSSARRSLHIREDLRSF